MVLSENGSLPPKFISIGNTVINSRIFECFHVFVQIKLMRVMKLESSSSCGGWLRNPNHQLIDGKHSIIYRISSKLDGLSSS